MWSSAAVSFVLPGFAAGVRGAWLRMAVLSLLVLAADALLLWTVWAIAAQLAVRVIAAIDGARVARRPPTGRTDLGGWIAAAVAVIGAVALAGAVHLYRLPSVSMQPTLEIGDRVLLERASPLWRSPARGDVIVFHYPCEPERDYDKRVVGVAGDTIEVRCEVLFVNGVAAERELVDPAHAYDDYEEMTKTWFPRTAALFQETLDGRSYQTFGVPLGAAEMTAHDFPLPDAHGAPPRCPPESPGAQPLGAIVHVASTGDPCALADHFVVPAGSLFVLGDNRANSNDSRYWGVVPLDQVIGRVVGVVWSTARSGAWARFGDLR